MARINHVKKAQQRYEQVPVLDEAGSPVETPVMRDGVQKVTKNGKPVTRRQTVDDKSQPLPPYDCGACRQPIEVGTPYKWVKVKSGPYGGATYRRHEGCPSWRPSELSSSKMAGVYAAQEMVDDQIEFTASADDLTALAADVAEAIREVANEYRESAENIEEGFGHATYQSDELTEKADELDGWADEIESFDPGDPPECDHPDLEEGQDESECDWCVDGEQTEDAELYVNWLDEQRVELADLVSNCPV